MDEINNMGLNKLFEYIYIYDDRTPYLTRLMNVINQISYSYIILNHDNNILIDKINTEYLNNLLTYMETNNIDQFRLFPSGVSISITPEKFFEIKAGYYFSVATGIWKKESLLKITSEFKDHSYRCAECEQIQNYVKNNFKNYCVFSEEDIQLLPHGHFLPKIFPVLHVTSCNRWSISSPIEKYYIEELSKEYNIDLNIRGFKYIEQKF